MEMEGLVVSYDGLKNTLMYHGIHEYPIGGYDCRICKITSNNY